QSELRRLKARRRKQKIAEIEKIKRRHRLQHLELLDQELEDLVDALEPAHDASEILVLNHLAAEIDLDAVELVQNLLEPQLVGLVHDDEKHFIVRGPAVARALRLLGGEQRGKLEVTGIVQGALGRGLGHRGPFRNRAEYVRAEMAHGVYFREICDVIAAKGPRQAASRSAACAAGFEHYGHAAGVAIRDRGQTAV